MTSAMTTYCCSTGCHSLTSATPQTQALRNRKSLSSFILVQVHYTDICSSYLKLVLLKLLTRKANSVILNSDYSTQTNIYSLSSVAEIPMITLRGILRKFVGFKSANDYRLLVVMCYTIELAYHICMGSC